MKLLCSVFTLSSVLALCGGDSYWTTSWTTAYPVGPGVDLRGKMVTLSQSSGLVFYPPYYESAPAAGATNTAQPRTTSSPDWSTQWTTSYYTPSPPPPTAGVSVCLRFTADDGPITLFQLARRSPLTFTWSNPRYYLRSYYSDVYLSPRLNLWSPVRTQPWTSVCVVLDSFRNVVQVFQGGSMSVRKILPSRMVWSGEPVLQIPGFDGQVTDLEVWDYPLQYRQVFSFMQNYGTSGTVLTWSNIAYRPRGKILVEDTYAQRLSLPISSSEGEEQPIRSEQGRDKRLKRKKLDGGRRQRKRPIL